MRKLAIAGVSLALILGISSNVSERTRTVVQQVLQAITIERLIGDFSAQEKGLITDAVNRVNSKYPINLNLVILEAKMEEHGGAYPALNEPEFAEKYGEKLYNQLRGKNVFVLKDLSEYQYDAEHLWNSHYMPNPSSEELYKRTTIHEIGHIVYYFIATPQLEKTLFDIDFQNREDLQKLRMQHYGHPSFYTFFFAGVEKYDEGFRRRSVSETFSDILALQLLGYLDNVEDPLLHQKMEIIDKALMEYLSP